MKNNKHSPRLCESSRMGWVPDVYSGKDLQTCTHFLHICDKVDLLQISTNKLPALIFQYSYLHIAQWPML